MNTTRYCTISESIKESCKEVKLMRENKIKKNDLSDLFENINIWETE